MTQLVEEKVRILFPSSEPGILFSLELHEIEGYFRFPSEEVQ